MKIYADENFPFRTVVELRRLGHDVLTALGDERANQAISDTDVLRRAAELERAVLTLNRKDFKRLHEQNSNHAGIIICTEDADRSGQAQRISERIFKLKNLNNQLVRVYRPGRQ
jgi:predicted nuclease of predicted toxin-antitoxin system